jgi:hypothetical protein
LLAVASAMLVFFALSLLYLYGDRGVYFTLLEYWGVDPFRFPFLDMSGALAAWECARQGIDVIVSDPCDVLKRPYNYSPIWMSWSAVPFGVADTTAVGWICGLLFLLSLAILPPPRRGIELVLTILASLSASVVFAVERGNPAILLFMLALATALSAEGGLAIRLIGYALALLSTLVNTIRSSPWCCWSRSVSGFSCSSASPSFWRWQCSASRITAKSSGLCPTYPMAATSKACSAPRTCHSR